MSRFDGKLMLLVGGYSGIGVVAAESAGLKEAEMGSRNGKQHQDGDNGHDNQQLHQRKAVAMHGPASAIVCAFPFHTVPVPL